MPELVLGPLLRYVAATEATVWVEVDAPCRVSVLGAEAPTFCVNGHHFALVTIKGLEPASTIPYEVLLDGQLAWPEPDTAFPPSVIRTPAPDERTEIVFGSCRVCVPHREPYTLTKDEDDQGREIDSLHALARRMLERPVERWPHALVLLGDQVYADEVSPDTRAFIRARRDISQSPGEEIADFEEYCRLYREAWGEPTMRWLLSTVPSAMIFDDHDVHDDWNTSEAWVREMRAKPWWQERIRAALSSYWVFQHIGNLSPRELGSDELWQQVCGADDAGALLDDFAGRADRETDGAQWSYCRDIGPARLVMIDSRAGRVLEEGRRSLLDDREWEWLDGELRGDCHHLLVGTSLPWLLSGGMHDLEAWNEAVCGGAWGKRLGRLGEKIRQGLDLEHWAAFDESFRRLAGMLEEVAAGRRGAPPATVVALSGDVHHAYLSRVDFLGREVRSRVYQAVCSPFRNPLDANERRMVRFAASRAGTAVGRVLARAAGVKKLPITWEPVGRRKPWFDNQVATLVLDGRSAEMRLEKVGAGEPELSTVFEHRLT